MTTPEEAPSCATCGAGVQVTWCPAFTGHLCPTCRDQAAHRELASTTRPDGWAEAVGRDVTVMTL